MTTDPRDALVVPRDTSTLSESTQQWLSPGDRFRAIAAMTEIEEEAARDAQARRAQRLAEERAVVLEQRRAELAAEPAKERAGHQSASRLASERLDGGASRRRADGRDLSSYHQADRFQSAGPPYASGYRVRNYWEE